MNKNIFLVFCILFLFSCSTRPEKVVGVIQENTIYSKGRFPVEDDRYRSEDVKEEDIKLFDFYGKSLTEEERQQVKWSLTQLPPEYQLPPAGPLGPYFNTHLVWALDKQNNVIKGFRPINTTTGCDSGCSPVVFHLVIDKSGDVIDLLQQGDQLLRKVYHKPYDSEDLKKALTIAKTLPKILESVYEPKLLTNGLTVFPPQTWTAYTDTLVAGSAYTSFRIFEAAYLTKQYLSLGPVQKNKIREELNFVKSMALSPLNSVNSIRNAYQKMVKILDGPQFGMNSKKFLLAHPQSILLGLVSIGGPVDLINVKNFYKRKEYHTTHRLQYCDFLKSLLSFEKGQRFLLKMVKDQKSWPSCEVNLDKMIPLLGATLLDETELVKSLSKGMNFDEIPPVIKQESTYLEIYAKLSGMLQKDEARAKALATITTRFPKTNITALIQNLDGKSKEQYQKSLIETENEYKKELRRSFLQAELSLPTVVGVLKNKTVQIPIKGSGPQMYVFFASWCPHCKATLKEWAYANYSEEFWNKIKLVEVFAKTPGRKALDEFCDVTGLQKLRPQTCESVIQLNPDELTNRFYESLNLTGVPRIVIVKDNGNIGIFDYKLPHQDGQDLEKELELIFKEL